MWGRVWGYPNRRDFCRRKLELHPEDTIEAVVNQPILVNWSNNLPTTYPYWLPVNTNIHGNENDGQKVRTVVHLHGGRTLPRYDGYPTNFFYAGESDLYFYTNLDPANTGQTMWYHDHAVGLTANNVYAGLAGFYLLRNTNLEALLNLPKGPFEIPLVFQDRDFSTNDVNYPSLLLTSILHNYATVNGKVTPYLNVEPRRYRFRFLNGANFRTFNLQCAVLATSTANDFATTNVLTSSTSAPPFIVIGNDDGLLTQPVIVTNNIAMMPGERVDLVMDFTSSSNQWIMVQNIITAATAFNANPPNTATLPNIMLFKVAATSSSPDTSSTFPNAVKNNAVNPPTNINYSITTNLVAQSKVTRNITLDLANETPFPGGPFPTPTGATNTTSIPFALMDMTLFDAPITETPTAGGVEVWNIINLSSEAHPFHIHLLDFRVVSRVRFGGIYPFTNGVAPSMVTNYINDRANDALQPLSYYTNGANLAQSMQLWEMGPKDTVRAAPFSVTTIVMQWPTNAEFYSTPSGRNDTAGVTDGRYIYHCHLLDHEDNDMMRPLQLLAPNASFIRYDSGTFTVFGTRRGDFLSLETTDDLLFPAWAPVGFPRTSPNGGRDEILVPATTGSQRYYRVRRVLAP